MVTTPVTVPASPERKGMIVHVAGIDPGIVHTGVVVMHIDQEKREVEVVSELFEGLKNTADIAKFLARQDVTLTVVERYRTRSNFSHDADIVAAVSELAYHCPGGIALDNMGIKKLISKDLMQVLGVWDFSKRSNHQDLRSAARILLLGMLKDEEYNTLLSHILRDYLDDSAWTVRATTT